MTFSATDQRAFSDFETAAWGQMTSHYDGVAGSITRQAVAAILDAVAIREGESLLDVASGPGYVAAAAQERGARPAGVDFSPDMIRLAREALPDIAFDCGDAENLAYADASFDAVTCAFGMLHFPRPGRAVAEAHRVLRPGGRFAFTVWCDSSKGKLFPKLADALTQGASLPVKRPPGPSLYMLSDPLVSVALMDAARFTEIGVAELPCFFTVRTPNDILDFLLKCGARGAYAYEQQPAEARARIDQILRDEGGKALAVDGGRIPCAALLVTGIKGRA